MNDDEVLAMLKRAVREEAAERDPRLEKLTLGGLTAAEQQALEAEAAGSPDVARDVVASTPLDVAARDRLHAGVMGRLAAEAPAAAPSAPVRVGARVTSLAARRWQVASVVGALAVAASVALVAVRHAPSAGLVADYEIALVSADVPTRSAPSSAPVSGPLVQSSTRFDLVARPAADVTSPIAVRSFAVHSGAVRAWDVPAQVSSSGAVRITGDVRALFDDPNGPWEVVVAIAPAGAAPPPLSAIAGDATQADGWRLVRARFQVRLE